MQYFFKNLLTGLTTVFAWAPATVLLIMPFIGLYSGIVYISEMDTPTEIVRLISLCGIAVLGLAGYAGLSAICWGLKLPQKAVFPCLLCGIAALAGSLFVGYMSNNPLLQLSFTIEHVYLFICPLFFLLLHSVLAYKRTQK